MKRQRTSLKLGIQKQITITILTYSLATERLGCIEIKYEIEADTRNFSKKYQHIFFTRRDFL